MLFLAFCNKFAVVQSFGVSPCSASVDRAFPSHVRLQSSNGNMDLRSEAAQLLEKARLLRESLPHEQEKEPRETSTVSKTEKGSRWTVPESDVPGIGYRLYIDIGREQGTWMDPRWGASGKRIEFSVDVKFMSDTAANQTVVDRMVKDNFGGKSSPTCEVQTSPMARLRSGFDEMACHGGGYRIDTGRNGASTVRFYILVDGTPESGSSYGYVKNRMILFAFSLLDSDLTRS